MSWSRAIAPFELAIIQSGNSVDTASKLGTMISEATNIDTVMDDRQKSLIWKMKDADLIGYPVLAILGRSWEKERKVEIQCRRLGFQQNVDWADIPQVISQLLNRY